MNIGKQIEQVSQQKGVKASQLAERMGLSRNYIYTLFRAEDVSTEILKKAADALGVAITDFFSSEGSNSSSSGEVSSVAGAGGVALAAKGKDVSQTNLGDITLEIKGAAETAQLIERLVKCEQERESWERERAALQKIISTQDLLISTLQTGSGK